MAHIMLITFSIIGWILIVGLIFKIFCDRSRELDMIRDIKHDLESCKEELKKLK